MQSLPAIEINHLCFAYEKEYVLEDINASIAEGEYIAIIGPNGGGKSTLVKLILGLLTPQKGSVHIFGKSPEKMRHLIGYLPQSIDLNSDLPFQAKEVILQGRLLANKFRFNEKDYKLTEEIAKRLEISHLLEKRLSQLSGGQRQKVLLARALVSQPKILILDEPTAAIDLQAQRKIYQLLKDLDIIRLVISHDINIILEGVQKVFYINRKLYIHTNIPKNIKPTQGHFCEIELFEQLQRSFNA